MNQLTTSSRNWAMVAHLAGAASELMMPWFGFIGPALVWAMRSEDRDVSYHARQAMFFQMVTSALCWAITIGGAVFSCSGIGMLFWLAEIPVYIAAVGIPLYGAMRVSNGENFQYPIIGSLVKPDPPMLR